MDHRSRVLERYPAAEARPIPPRGERVVMWTIHDGPGQWSRRLGSGLTEQAAWEAAWSGVEADDDGG